jgi:hypothetical protein
VPWLGIRSAGLRSIDHSPRRGSSTTTGSSSSPTVAGQTLENGFSHQLTWMSDTTLVSWLPKWGEARTPGGGRPRPGSPPPERPCPHESTAGWLWQRRPSCSTTVAGCVKGRPVLRPRVVNRYVLGTRPARTNTLMMASPTRRPRPGRNCRAERELRPPCAGAGSAPLPDPRSLPGSG